MSTPHPRSAPDAGFSLIEMMAALSVLAIAGLALVNMTTTTTRNTAAVEQRALAMTAAETLLNTEWLRAGRPRDRSGRYDLAGQSWDWRLDVSPTDDDGLVRLTMAVSDPQSGAVLAEIDTFRRVRS